MICLYFFNQLNIGPKALINFSVKMAEPFHLLNRWNQIWALEL